MKQRPTFYRFDNACLGRCVLYPVEIHIAGRQWKENLVVVPLKEWDNGVRMFSFVEGNAVITCREYVPSAKMERNIAKAVADAKEYFAKRDKLKQLREELRSTKEELRNMSKDYNFATYDLL